MFYRIIRFILFVFFKIFFGFEVIGIENLPEDRPLLICPNHKSNWDPAFIDACLKHKIYWMAKKELWRNKLVGKFIEAMGAFPVDRQTADVKSVKNALRILKNGEIVGIFPEGTRVRKIDYSMAKPGVAMIAHRARTLIVPMYIDGNYKLFKKMKLVIKEPIDIRDLEKQNIEQYESIASDILKTIYNGVDGN
ncbi:1-acyl-sn-glycerol-3-phosphate acyltransferase [Peptoniphilus sp. oral taxon 386]|uniref:lysophospholipid acyltransferase family protein n=1 Tax=Peptoniphilus sp. oral taxon 386 TaxID=652713 RepID=UPI0001DA9BE8|nr:lysophospholipid acyltransferase family protein [Peptoniphilus sp. oral taxon 386]EFI42587.1 Acyltransferase [Peptoniphilus sp. oral taxon 386 str. F0131]